jgi:energy-coupling factor transporter ATP-binding protein EcfA2
VNIDEQIGSARFNVFLGKNGSGKSTLLRNLDSRNDLTTKYISPERGGVLKYDPGVDQNIANDVNWLINDRRKNRTESFRQQSAAQYRNLELAVLREENSAYKRGEKIEQSFEEIVGQINQLLPMVEFKQSERTFTIHQSGGDEIAADQISSGESELIALAIEILVFSRSAEEGRILLLDEPDVHLHPDLQEKLIAFLEKTATDRDFKVAIATHSTAIIGAFSEGADVKIVPLISRDQADFEAFSYDPICHEILPIFGCHPLSGQFNKTPVLLVEGDDDKRVIEQLVRSGGGRFAFAPCVVGTVTEMSKWENWLSTYLPSIYDDPQGFSLRDLDDAENPEIEDIGCVARSRLNCYAIENLLLTNECLAQFDEKPKSFQKKLRKWAEENPKHQTTEALLALVENFDERRTQKIKDIRNVITALLGTSKPWEVLVGQLIAQNIDNKSDDANSLHTYLGHSVMDKLLPIQEGKNKGCKLLKKLTGGLD